MNTLELLKKYHAYLRPTLFFFIVAVIFEIIVILLGLLTPMLTRVLFDYAYQFKNLTILNVTILAIIVTYFLYFFISVLSDYLETYVNQEASANLTTDTFFAIQSLPLSFHKEKSSGDLLIRITDDVSNTINTVMSVLPSIIIDGSKFLIILYIALTINPKLTLLALLSIPFYIIETRFYAKRLQEVEEEIIDADSGIYSRAHEKLSAIKTVKAFAQEKNETLSFRSLVKKRYKIAVKEKALSILRTFTNSITLQIWTVFITWYLGYQVVLGNLSIGEVVALMLYLEQLAEPIESISNFVTSWKTNLVSMRRVKEVLDYPSESSLVKGDKNLEIENGDIKTDHLSFSYVDGEEVLHDVDADFFSHNLTAIVGESGGGKSTLINLFLRFFDVTKGAIFIDGQNISEVKIKSLRDKIGLIEQEYVLFEGTVIENILYGNENKTYDDAINAAHLASAYDFIMRLPKGFETEIGKGGSFLSTGQRQRLAIARTLLKDPEIIIFDEATSALDPESEFHIQEVINKLKLTRTVLVIAHRLSTIKMASQILVLEEGSFVEQGSFEELLEKKGAFYRFYWKQFGGLAAFRQNLLLEIERAARYDSHFCLAAFKYLPYQDIVEQKDNYEADKYMDEIDYMIKKSMRIGDNCALFEKGMILLLLPEITEEQISSFFHRLADILIKQELSNGNKIDKKDMLLIGSRIKGKEFKTPEQLISVLTKKVKKLKIGHGFLVLSKQDL